MYYKECGSKDGQLVVFIHGLNGFSFENAAFEVIKLIEELSPDRKVILIAHSYGGLVIFRLGISLKRNAVSLWVAIAPAILIWYLISKNYIIVGVALVIGLLIGAYIFFRTDDSLWDKVGAKLSLAVVWISALAFGLLHLNAFTDMSWAILPYALCICV